MRRLLLAAMLAAGPVHAATVTVTVTVTNVRSAKGHVRVAICSKAEFLGKNCRFHVAAPSQAGATVLRIDVPPGVYAAQGYLDEHDWGEVRQTWLGIPEEGICFSRDAPINLGPPKWADAAFTVGPDGAAISMRLRYF